MYEMMTCSECGEMAYYPDEVAVGFWVHDGGLAVKDNIFATLSVADITDATGTSVPEGAKVYCLECTPCECGEHQKFATHTAENIVAYEGGSK